MDLSSCWQLCNYILDQSYSVSTLIRAGSSQVVILYWPLKTLWQSLINVFTTMLYLRWVNQFKTAFQSIARVTDWETSYKCTELWICYFWNSFRLPKCHSWEIVDFMKQKKNTDYIWKIPWKMKWRFFLDFSKLRSQKYAHAK